jgi:hypothetical protein
VVLPTPPPGLTITSIGRKKAMAEHACSIRGATPRNPPPLELVDLDAHPDGALLRVCASLERLRVIAEEMERVAASLPARTMLGRRMKEMAL